MSEKSCFKHLIFLFLITVITISNFTMGEEDSNKTIISKNWFIESIPYFGLNPSLFKNRCFNIKIKIIPATSVVSYLSERSKKDNNIDWIGFGNVEKEEIFDLNVCWEEKTLGDLNIDCNVSGGRLLNVIEISGEKVMKTKNIFPQTVIEENALKGLCGQDLFYRNSKIMSDKEELLVFINDYGYDELDEMYNMHFRIFYCKEKCIPINPLHLEKDENYNKLRLFPEKTKFISSPLMYFFGIPDKIKIKGANDDKNKTNKEKYKIIVADRPLLLQYIKQIQTKEVKKEIKETISLKEEKIKEKAFKDKKIIYFITNDYFAAIPIIPKIKIVKKDFLSYCIGSDGIYRLDYDGINILLKEKFLTREKECGKIIEKLQFTKGDILCNLLKRIKNINLKNCYPCGLSFIKNEIYKFAIYKTDENGNIFVDIYETDQNKTNGCVAFSELNELEEKYKEEEREREEILEETLSRYDYEKFRNTLNKVGSYPPPTKKDRCTENQPKDARKAYIYYHVKKGDTLTKIARYFEKTYKINVNWGDLEVCVKKEWEKAKYLMSDIIYPTQQIRYLVTVKKVKKKKTKPEKEKKTETKPKPKEEVEKKPKKEEIPYVPPEEKKHPVTFPKSKYYKQYHPKDVISNIYKENYEMTIVTRRCFKIENNVFTADNGKKIKLTMPKINIVFDKEYFVSNEKPCVEIINFNYKKYNGKLIIQMSGSKESLKPYKAKIYSENKNNPLILIKNSSNIHINNGILVGGRSGIEILNSNEIYGTNLTIKDNENSIMVENSKYVQFTKLKTNSKPKVDDKSSFSILIECEGIDFEKKNIEKQLSINCSSIVLTPGRINEGKQFKKVKISEEKEKYTNNTMITPSTCTTTIETEKKLKFIEGNNTTEYVITHDKPITIYISPQLTKKCKKVEINIEKVDNRNIYITGSQYNGGTIEINIDNSFLSSLADITISDFINIDRIKLNIDHSNRVLIKNIKAKNGEIKIIGSNLVEFTKIEINNLEYPIFIRHSDSISFFDSILEGHNIKAIINSEHTNKLSLEKVFFKGNPYSDIRILGGKRFTLTRVGFSENGRFALELLSSNAAKTLKYEPPVCGLKELYIKVYYTGNASDLKRSSTCIKVKYVVYRTIKK